VRQRRGIRLALGTIAVALLAAGMVIGARLDGDDVVQQTVTVASPPPAVDAPRRSDPSRSARESASRRTRAGAVFAATSYVGALGGTALLDPARLRRTVRSIGSSAARADLETAYRQAANAAREQLGVGAPPEPVVILRTAPIGYRIDAFSRAAATISIWRVGIVGSGATVEPQQSWRTETVSLVWENGDWKVAALRSSPGPTPPLGTPAATPTDLFTSIPTFAEFERAIP
jgi:hypothetical protein